MTTLLHRLAALAAIAFLAAIVGGAQAQNQRPEQRQHQPGQFDFYVLALSWSPTFCEANSERGRADGEQCGGRPYHFVVHGLWPQYERGFPRDCKVPAPRLNREIVNSMLDLMPAPRLVFHEWDKHGTCSGLEARAYFDLVRQARGAITIPEPYRDVKSPLMVEPAAIEDAFVGANPGLSRDGIAVTCDSRRLSEVRICLTKDLKFRNCAEIDRRACRLDKVVMPPLREGAARTSAQSRP